MTLFSTYLDFLTLSFFFNTYICLIVVKFGTHHPHTKPKKLSVFVLCFMKLSPTTANQIQQQRRRTGNELISQCFDMFKFGPMTPDHFAVGHSNSGAVWPLVGTIYKMCFSWLAETELDVLIILFILPLMLLANVSCQRNNLAAMLSK